MEDKATQTPEQTFSMEAALQETEARLEKRVRPGQILTGKVVLVGSEGVAVDIGAKTEGIIPFNQLTTKPLSEEELRNLLSPGDEVKVQVLRVDPETGQILLSRKKIEAQEKWDRIQELYEKGEPVTVTIKERVKGGVVAELDGVQGFMPASQLDLRRVPNLDEFVGQQVLAKIIEFHRRKGRVILSRRAVLEEEQKKAREAFLKSPVSGQVVEGTVVEVTDFGVFVNLGPVDGLVHRSEITWGRFNHPREVIQKGQKVKAQVLSVDPEKERVNLSIKALIPDPWTTVAEKYPVGTRVRGKVVGLTQFGAFVEVEPGLRGPDPHLRALLDQAAQAPLRGGEGGGRGGGRGPAPGPRGAPPLPWPQADPARPLAAAHGEVPARHRAEGQGHRGHGLRGLRGD